MSRPPVPRQVPLTEVRQSADKPVLGVWASADRKSWKQTTSDGKVNWSGPWVQVSRLGNPLINEVIIPRIAAVNRHLEVPTGGPEKSP